MGLIKDFQYDPVVEWGPGVLQLLSERTGGLTPSGSSVAIPSGSGLQSVRQELDDGDS